MKLGTKPRIEIQNVLGAKHPEAFLNSPLVVS